MHSVYIPSQAGYSPWFNASTQPPVRSGMYQIRSSASAASYAFRYFDASAGLSGQWRYSMYGPRTAVGRLGLSYEWRGLLASGERFDECGTLTSHEESTTFTLPATITLGGDTGLRLWNA